MIGRWRQVAVRQTILTASPQECSIAQYGALHTFRWDELLAVHDRPYVGPQGEHEAEVMSQVRLEVRPGMFVLGGRTLIVAEGHDDATRAWLAGALEAARARATRGAVRRRTDSVRPSPSVEEPEGSRG